MKPHLKKLKTCAYSTDLAASPFGQKEHHTNKLVCDHPEMKINWQEKVCGSCDAYLNRNADLAIPVPQPEPAPPSTVPVAPVTSGGPKTVKPGGEPALSARLAPPAPIGPGPGAKPTPPAAPPTEPPARAPVKREKEPAPKPAKKTSASPAKESKPKAGLKKPVKKETGSAKKTTEAASKKPAGPEKKPSGGKK